MKKILSVSLILALILGILCIFPTSAERFSNSIDCGDYWYITLDDNTAAIGADNPDLSGAVVIPETIDGYIVTEIANNGFSGAKITDITIPNTVTRLGDYSFSYCPNLKTVNIPNSVTTIDFCAFANCPMLTYMFVPGSVTYIGETAIGYEDNYVDNDGVMLPDGGYVPIGQMVIEGYNGTAAEKYAKESHFTFVKAPEYKDKVLSLLNIPEEDPGTGEGWLLYYREIYEHFECPATSDEATPDYVLIEVYNTASSPMPQGEKFGDYVLYTPSLRYPYAYGYCIYLPTGVCYPLSYAYEMGIKGIDNVFTEAGIGTLIGDCNDDGNISIKDATAIQKHLAGLTNLEGTSSAREYYHLVADYNRDEKVNIRDATAIQKHLAGLDCKEVNYNVLEISEATSAGNYNSVKTVARNRTELKNVLAKITETVGGFEPDEKFNDEYFEEKSVVVIADVIGGSCCSQEVKGVMVDGAKIIVNRYINKAMLPVPDMNYQYILIEVDRADVTNVKEVQLKSSETIYCF